LLDTVIFIGPPDLAKRVEQVLWPAHCIQKTPGADLHRDLILVDNAIHVYKGTNPEIDSYSAFWDNMKLSKTSLDDQLKERFVTDVYVVGLATDVCVCMFYLCYFEQKKQFRFLLLFSINSYACC
jgi:nicotinamidase-related amidase